MGTTVPLGTSLNGSRMALPRRVLSEMRDGFMAIIVFRSANNASSRQGAKSFALIYSLPLSAC
jgi:hypothetical protein